MLLQHVNKNIPTALKNIFLIVYIPPASPLLHLPSIILFCIRYEALKLHVIAAVSVRALNTKYTTNLSKYVYLYYIFEENFDINKDLCF